LARVFSLAAAAIAAGVLAGCGSSSSGSSQSAKTLLRETFSGSHTVDSGVLNASLTLSPSGSTVVNQPIVLSFGGPFQSRGAKALPASDFTASIGFEGNTGSIGFLSTGTAGYVELSGTAYPLPSANFRQLESGFSSLSGSGSKGSSGLFSSGGVNPEHWVTDPTVLGTETVGGAKTEHIRGAIAIKPLLSDFSRVLAKAPSVSAGSTSVPKTISPATQAKIASEVKNATFDLWTGASDHTIRRLTVAARLPIKSGSIKGLGNLNSVGVSFTLGYSQVGQKQTITAPTSTQPYSQFQTKISQTIAEIESLIVSAESGAAGTTTTP
jgi:hypothetical protein